MDSFSKFFHNGVTWNDPRPPSVRITPYRVFLSDGTKRRIVLKRVNGIPSPDIGTDDTEERIRYHLATDPETADLMKSGVKIHHIQNW